MTESINRLLFNEEDAACVCDECGCSDVETVDDCVVCKSCGHKKELVTEEWNKVVSSLLQNDTQTAQNAMADIIKNIVSSKANRPVSEAYDKYRNSIRFRSNDVIINGKKVATLGDHDEGFVLNFPDGEKEEFSSVKELVAFLHDKFDLKESVSVINEATSEQKNVIKALRKLAKNLNINKPRFRSEPGRAGNIELSVKESEDELPNELRKKAAVKVLNIVPTNFSDVKTGGIKDKHMTLTASQWMELLGHYGIELPEQVTESVEILTEGKIRDAMEKVGLFLAKWKKLIDMGKKFQPKEEKVTAYQKTARTAAKYAAENGDQRTEKAFRNFADAFDDFLAGGMNPELIDDLGAAYSQTLNTKFMR